MSRLSQAGWDRLLTVVPAAIAAIAGVTWIALHASSERGQTHTLFQLLALAENVVALLLCRRKPVGALASILVVYFLVDLEFVTGLPVLFATANLAVTGSRRAVVTGAAAAAAVVVSMPYAHGDHTTVAAGIARVAAVGCAVAAGYGLRTWRGHLLRPSPGAATITAETRADVSP